MSIHQTAQIDRQSNSTILISVIIPVYNDCANLAQCLASLAQSQFTSFEIIVVDDASNDGSGEMARGSGCRLFRLDENLGASAARNYGARQASGAILFFLDADICVQPETLARIARTFDNHRDLAALFGSYQRDTVPADFFSNYKNLLHHFTHQTSSPNAITFCGGYGAVRANVFSEFHGFDESRRALEDIEFGYRLHRAGRPILLDKELQFTHLKKYSLSSLLASDFFNRAIPWTRLMLENGIFRSDLNTKTNNVLSVGLAFLLLGAPLLTWALPFGFWIAAGCAALFIALNWNFLRFVWRARGAVFLLKTILMHWFFYIYSGIGFLVGVLAFIRSRIR